jgi:Co/Zn/Cd efflux system component
MDTIHEVPGVAGVHDLHVWTISSGMDALSAHVTIEPDASHAATLELLQERLRSGFNIDHLTIQIESPDETEMRKLYQIVRRGDAETSPRDSKSV